MLDEAELTEQQLLAMPDRAYMNDAQLGFFRRRLQRMRADLLAQIDDTAADLDFDFEARTADPADRATLEETNFLAQRLLQRQTQLLQKVDAALRRIQRREYGYCLKTGEPIGLARLLVRPTAALSVDAKGIDESHENHFRPG